MWDAKKKIVHPAKHMTKHLSMKTFYSIITNYSSVQLPNR